MQGILKELFERHIHRIERKVVQLEKLSGKISGFRLGLFVATVAFAFIAAEQIPGWLYTILLVGLIIVFFAMINRHRKVEQFIEKLGYLKQIKAEHIARIELDWERIPFKKIDREEHLHHPYAWDLNVIGKRSLFHLMDTSIYEGSEKVFSNWLLKEDRDKSRIVARQELIQELVPLQIFRDKLKIEAVLARNYSSSSKWTMDELLQWLRLPKKTGFKFPILILILLSISNISLGILALLGQISGLFFLVSFVSYLTVSKLTSQKVKGLFDAAFQMEKLLGTFSNILNHVERFKVSDNKKISHFLNVYQEEKEKPSKNLRKVRRFAVAASIQKDQLLGPFVNLMVPWNMYFAMKLEDLKEDLEPKLTKWLDKFYELEALSSIANFTYLNPQYSFPTFAQDSDPLFKARKLGHPLIPENQKVANDFEVNEGKDLFLITGSNMAGKSTFLRTVGINLVLAYSGAPVDAEFLNTNLFRVFTSINVNDSLSDGLSHFYAEVKRLRQLLDELNTDNKLPLFFFVDEIYKGTNNRERFAGSAAFLKEVAGKDGIGMVSTHDLELADLESEIIELSNWHFSESISDGKMSFEYKLEAGPCPSTNALKIMEIEGLPVE